MVSAVIITVASGETEGSVVWWNSCTRPPVITAEALVEGVRRPSRVPVIEMIGIAL